MEKKKVFIIFGILCLMIVQVVSASVQSDFLNLVNQERIKLGRQPLYYNLKLEQAAYLHSQDMAVNNYFSHVSLNGTTFDKRIILAGYTNFIALGENIAYHSGTPDAQKVFDMWKNSPGHYSNMIGDYNEMGIGIYYYNGLTYYTQDLAKNPSLKINSSITNITSNSSYPKINNTINITKNDSVVINKTYKDFSIMTTKYITSLYNIFNLKVNSSSYFNFSLKYNNLLYRICYNCKGFSINVMVNSKTPQNITIVGEYSNQTLSKEITLV